MTPAVWREEILRRLVHANNMLRINTNRWRGPWTSWNMHDDPLPADTPAFHRATAERLDQVAEEIRDVAHDMRARADRLESEKAS